MLHQRKQLSADEATRSARAVTLGHVPYIAHDGNPAQLRLQAHLNQSPQVQRIQRMQARADAARSSAPVQKVIQRNIDSTAYERTHALAPNYLINPAARTRLYSAQTAPPPEPQDLYTKYAEHDDAGIGRDLYAWVPNVRLMDDAEKQDFNLNEDDREEAVTAFKNIVENRHDGNALRNPTIGIMGKNDCGAFATALYNSIARSKFRRIGGEGDLQERIQTYVNNYPAMEVGDMMRHIFEQQEGVEGGSGWHAATVVAKQGGSLVTLEANVAFSLRAPEFYVRAGSAGFVHDNHNDGEVGNSLEVSKYQGGQAPDDDLDRYDRMDVNPTVMGGNLGTYENVELYHQSIRRDVRRLLTEDNCLRFWRGQTILGNDMPDAIVEMRAVIDGNFNTMIAIGAAKAADKPFARSADTHYFYQLLKRYQDFNNAPGTATALKPIHGAIRQFPRRM